MLAALRSGPKRYDAGGQRAQQHQGHKEFENLDGVRCQHAPKHQVRIPPFASLYFSRTVAIRAMMAAPTNHKAKWSGRWSTIPWMDASRASAVEAAATIQISQRRPDRRERGVPTARGLSDRLLAASGNHDCGSLVRQGRTSRFAARGRPDAIPSVRPGTPAGGSEATPRSCSPAQGGGCSHRARRTRSCAPRRRSGRGTATVRPP